jgi:membrane protein
MEYQSNSPSFNTRREGLMKQIVLLFKEAFDEWNRDKAPLYAAALTYFMLFSISPLLIVIISIAGLVFGNSMAQQQVFGEIESTVGTQGANALQGFLAQSSKPEGNIIAIVVGIVVAMFGASLIFIQTKAALNIIWDAPPEQGGGFMGVVKKRLMGMLMVAGMGALLMLAIVISMVVSFVRSFLSRIQIEHMPDVGFAWELLNLGVFVALLTLLFGIIFKVLPDVKIAWRDLWVGSFVTAILFTIGKYLIVWYVSNSSVGSTYGAAGSLVVLLVWVHYSAQIFFYGAEFTHIYATKFGSLGENTHASVSDERDYQK